MGLYNPTFCIVPAARQTRVIVADQYPVILLGLRKVFEDDPRFQVVAEASDMLSVWKNLVAERPEVALLDWSTASQNLEITRALIQSDQHATSIIFLTVSDDSQEEQHMLRLGVRAFVSKWSSPELIRGAVRKACKEPVKPEAAGRLLPVPINEVESRIRQLTKRERQLIPLVCSGRRNKEIAVELGISESTVWHHLTAVFTKLQVEDRLGLAAFAYSHGLVHSRVQSTPDAPGTVLAP
ncbi:MAG: response regulator transcription factor [Acidobacteriaceae bacterium]